MKLVTACHIQMARVSPFHVRFFFGGCYDDFIRYARGCVPRVLMRFEGRTASRIDELQMLTRLQSLSVYLPILFHCV